MLAGWHSDLKVYQDNGKVWKIFETNSKALNKCESHWKVARRQRTQKLVDNTLHVHIYKGKVCGGREDYENEEEISCKWQEKTNMLGDWVKR